MGRTLQLSLKHNNRQASSVSSITNLLRGSTLVVFQHRTVAVPALGVLFPSVLLNVFNKTLRVLLAADSRLYISRHQGARPFASRLVVVPLVRTALQSAICSRVKELVAQCTVPYPLCATMEDGMDALPAIIVPGKRSVAGGMEEESAGQCAEASK